VRRKCSMTLPEQRRDETRTTQATGPGAWLGKIGILPPKGCPQSLGGAGLACYTERFSVFCFSLGFIKHRVTKNEKRKTNNDGYRMDAL
jgi:hypothetical protein